MPFSCCSKSKIVDFKVVISEEPRAREGDMSLVIFNR
jgi:hypothetical protein